MKHKVWLITGCSSGFGKELVRAVLENGDKVVATARNTSSLDWITEMASDHAITLELDVTKPQQVRETIAAAIKHFGRIDVLVNNAGYGLLGAIEEVTDEQARQQFEVNVFGALDMMRAILPDFRKQRSGHILNISSVGGFVAFPGVGIYNASKFALEALSESLYKETAPLGIKVTLIEPGPFRTDWAGRSSVVAADIDDYAETAGIRKKTIQGYSGTQDGDPYKAALAMIKVVESENPPLRLPLGVTALDSIRCKIHQVAKELNEWESVTINTSFDK
jgi:NAD(P)-dependent dehydrogenase (short-subunit alcohol dehydrogenase family)